MLNLAASRINRSDEQPYSGTVDVVGCVLVQAALGTVTKGNGAATEIFTGVSLAQPLTLFNFPKVEALIPNAQAQITLFAAANQLIAGTLRVADTAVPATTIASGTPTGTNVQYSISGNVITLNSSGASRVGVSTTVFYQYAPSPIQARTMQGDIQPGGAASLTTGTVGVIRAGTVFTTEYDPLVDWTTAGTTASLLVRTGANGRFTLGGTGCIVPNAQVIQYPVATSITGNAQGGSYASSPNDSLLGLYFSA